ncbi:MAG TPA: hypothetical protein VGP70_11420 [Actinomadura sp.]|nr:hypothetical protein [Actinomadura sp.]
MKRMFTGGALGALAARTAYSTFTRRPPAPVRNKDADVWGRVNHRGEQVTLLEGPAVVVGAALGALLTPGLSPRMRAAALLAGVGSGLLGGYDDLAGSASSKGFKGHLGALARGQLTSGGVKLLGIGATGLAAAALARSRRHNALDVLANGAILAGSANLMNLFDLRPGRAIKAGLIAGTPLALASSAAAAIVAAPLGAAAALLPEDLRERAMLGDAGANALGALLGLATTTLGRGGRLAVLTGLVALNGASEFVSFTKVIQRTPLLHRLDMLGRRPPHTSGAEASEGAGRAAHPAQ